MGWGGGAQDLLSTSQGYVTDRKFGGFAGVCGCTMYVWCINLEWACLDE